MTAPIDAAGRALRQWGIEPVDLVEVSRSENIVFRVDAGDGNRYVLRLHRPGYHSYRALVSEQTWTAALAEAGVDVPIPRPTLDGEPYGKIRIQNEERIVGLLEWVDGRTMRSLMEDGSSTADRNASRFRQLGGLLADLHQQASRWRPPPGFVRHALDADGLMGPAPRWGPFWQARALTPGQRERFSDLRHHLHRILRDLPTDPDRFSMIHADLHPGNVVISGGRLHVIDFDDAGSGWHAYDLAVALKDYQDDPDFDTYQTALIQGYRRRRALADDVLDRIPLFLLIRALASIGWADARPELGHPEYVPGLAEYAEARADAILAPYG